MQHKNKRIYFEKGLVFGRLTLTGVTNFEFKPSGTKRRLVEAICECGKIGTYDFNSITRGDTKSCGCFRKEVASKQGTVHGLSKHLLYDVWGHIKSRCFNENDKNFPNYGGRGITMCDEWKNDFLSFFKWAIDNGYDEGLSLDRKNNDGNYEPDNCRYATRQQQSTNTRDNRLYVAFGKVKCLFDWAKDSRCVVGQWTLRGRMDSGKYSMEEAMTTPADDGGFKLQGARSRKGNRNLTAWGETKCFSEWLEDPRCLVKIDSLRDRLAKGWDAEKSMGTPPTRDGKNVK